MCYKDGRILNCFSIDNSSMNIRKLKLIDEITFSASRSSGAGGQNINKVNTKVELRFVVGASAYLSNHEKALISKKLANKINDAGELIIVSQNARSQFKNKESVIEKFFNLIEKALKPVKSRYATKPTKASKERRRKGKEIQARKKLNRRNIIE